MRFSTWNNGQAVKILRISTECAGDELQLAQLFTELQGDNVSCVASGGEGFDSITITLAKNEVKKHKTKYKAVK